LDLEQSSTAPRRWTNSRDMCKRGGNEAQRKGQIQREIPITYRFPVSSSPARHFSMT
jgi:hypothetical protein